MNQIMDLAPSATSLVFSILGLSSAFKCLVERKLMSDRIWVIALFSSVLPSLLLHWFGNAQSFRSHSIYNYLTWQSFIPLFWILVWYCVTRFQIDTSDMLEKNLRKDSSDQKIGQIVLVGLVVIFCAWSIFYYGTSVMFGSECTKIKCKFAEVLFGNRRVILPFLMGLDSRTHAATCCFSF
jgi:hypothetical protein